MLKKILIGAGVLAMSVPVIASGYDRYAGLYSNNDVNGMEVSADVTRVQPNVYTVSLSTTVAMQGGQPGCGGGVDGRVTLRNGRGILRAPNEQYTPGRPGGSPHRYCEISVTFGRNSLQTQELRGCTGYHGAACSFTGRLEHDAAGI